MAATESFTFEQLGTFCAAGLSNFGCLPALYIIWRRGLLINTYVGIFTLSTSFLYHATDALGVESLYLTPTQWHKLDNIGSVLSMILLLIYLMDNLDRNSLGELESRHESRSDRHLTYWGLLLTISMQTKNPWDIFNTYFPILIFLGIFIFRVAQRRPRLNAVMFRRGMGLLGIAICLFVLGLDDERDYLRIMHGLWHTIGSFSMFYLMQSIDKDKPDPKLQIARLPKMERFSFWQACCHLATLQFIRAKPSKAN
jgi:hypothetical protein